MVYRTRYGMLCINSYASICALLYHPPFCLLISVNIYVYRYTYGTGKLYFRKCCQLGTSLSIYTPVVVPRWTRANTTCVNISLLHSTVSFCGIWIYSDVSEIFISKELTRWYMQGCRLCNTLSYILHSLLGVLFFQSVHVSATWVKSFIHAVALVISIRDENPGLCAALERWNNMPYAAQRQ